jgi:hypothetical protein
MALRKHKLELWNEYLKVNKIASDLSDRSKEILNKIVGYYVDNTQFISDIYTAFSYRERFVEDEETDIHFERDEEDYILACEGKEVIFTKEAFKEIITSMLDLLEDTLPLGTVVELKQETFKDNKAYKEVEHVRMVITHRFLGKDEDKFYFPYAGVVFPTGMLGHKEVLYFTRPLIETVLQKGYTNEEEEGFVNFMKNELIIEKGKHTFGYANEEDIEVFNKRIKKGKG